MLNKVLLLAFCFVVFFSCHQNSSEHISLEAAAFKILDSSETGLHFSNKLELSIDMNIFNYMYFYNGAGVGAGDFNNDGLIDLYFSSNQGSNKLFLNEGGMKFKDVSKDSGIEIPEDAWSNGVSIVDFNNDGLLDIYVTQLGAFQDLEGRNLFFICQSIDENGIPIYKEMAEEIGLAQSSFGTQTLFFDADLDGDLDVFQMNHSLHANGTFGQRKNFAEEFHPTSGDKYLENQNGRFVEKTKDAGINSSVIGYGLGIVASDLNLDGLPDLYVGNDFHENDYLYVNQGNGIFKEDLTNQMMHTSRFSMGVDAADINNDLYPDLITLDMLPSDPYILKTSEGEDAFDIFKFKLGYGYNYQYAKNSLQVNQGNNTYSELAMYAGVHATDWSWAALLFDFDNDGYKDAFISNGIPKRMNDIDYINFVEKVDIQNRIRTKAVEDKDVEMIDNLPEIKLPNRFFKNNGDLTFQDLGPNIFNDKNTYSNGAIYADLDNDGDLDVVVNNIDDEALVYENNSNPNPESFLSLKLKGAENNINAIGSKVIVYKKDQTIFHEKFPLRGFQSSMEIPFHLGIGDVNEVDSIHLVWPDNTYQKISAKDDSEISYTAGLAKFNYEQLKRRNVTFNSLTDQTKQLQLNVQHKENPFIEFNRESLIPHMTSSEGPALAVGDVNGDGLDDFYIGSSKRKLSKVYVQQQNGTFIQRSSEVFRRDSISEEVSALLIDVDGDKDLDLVTANGGSEYSVTSEWNSPRVYSNDGKGSFSSVEGAFPNNVKLTASCIISNDINGDGYPDLFIGARAVSRSYGVLPSSYVLINDGKGKYMDKTEEYAPELTNYQFVKDAQWSDLNGDKELDLILALEWGAVEAFIRKGSKFERRKLIDKHGWWNFVLPYDFDNDGDIDILAGNLGLNSRLKASEEQPIRMYYNDFDANGTKEQLLTYYIDDKEIPFANKHELETQLPYLKKDFLLAKDFAKASLNELIGKDNLSKAQLSYVDYFQNAILINNGNLQFEVKSLADNLQWTSYNDAIVVDANGDELMDVFMGGNFYDNNIQMGRLDSDLGSLLINKGNGEFEKAFTPEVKIRAQIRNIKRLKGTKDQNMILVATNNDSLRILRIDPNQKEL